MKTLLTLLTLAQVANAEVPRLSTEKLIQAPENHALKEFLQEGPQPQSLAGKRIAVITTDGVEEIEIVGAIDYLKHRGAKVSLVAPRRPELPAKYGVEYPEKRKTHILTVRFMENATWLPIDTFIEEAKAENYDAILIAGGAWNPDALRSDVNALRLVKAFDRVGKPIAAICHGPLVLVSAEVTVGRRMTSYWNVQVDLKNSGAVVVDEPAVVDGHFVTSRFPYDLPAFMEAFKTLLTR